MDELVAGPPDPIFNWMREKSGLTWTDDFSGFARKINGEIVSAVGYTGHTGTACSMHLVLGKYRLGKRMLYFMFDVPFNQWGYKNLIAVVPGTAPAAQKLATRLGFKEFAILPEAHPGGGLRFYVMSKGDCPWLHRLERR